MNQENDSESCGSIVRDRKKMFEQNDKVIGPAYPKHSATIPKKNKETKVVTSKSESSRLNLNQSSISTDGKPPERLQPIVMKKQVTKTKMEILQNNHKIVEVDIKSEPVSQSENMKSSLAKNVKFYKDVVLPPDEPSPKTRNVNQDLNTLSSTKLQQSNLNRLQLVPPPPPPPPTKSEIEEKVKIAETPLFPLPPPSTEAEILKPNSPNTFNLISPSFQKPPVPPPPSSIKSDSEQFSKPPTVREALNQNTSSKVNLVNQKHPVPPPPPPPPPPPSVILAKSEKEISNSGILSSTALAPPTPPLPSSKGIGTMQDALNYSPEDHSVPQQLQKTFGNKISDTGSCENLTPPVPPPPPNAKIARQSNNFIGWATISSNEQRTNSNESNISVPIENKNKKPPETTKAPPIVATPPSLESVRKVKEKVRIDRRQENSEDVYDEDDDILNQPWYFDVTKDQATEIFRKFSKKGTYMMRPSQDDQYVLMVRIDINETKKFKIQKYNDGWILGEPNTMKKTHPSLFALMEHYQTNGVKFSNTTLILKEPVSKK